MTIVEKNGKKYDLNNYNCKCCDYIDNSRSWTGYGKCERLDMVVNLDNSCGSHSLIEKDGMIKEI